MEGFCNWKKALKRFANHERWQTHKEACIKFNAITKQDLLYQDLLLLVPSIN